jgi:hypothetical protein
MLEERAELNAATWVPQNPQLPLIVTCHHEQAPRQVEPRSSQPLDPSTRIFNLQKHPIRDSPQQRTDIGPYVEFMARRELISNKIEKFNDKPKSYLVWKESFENMVKGVRISASERLSLLAEYTKTLVQKL